VVLVGGFGGFFNGFASWHGVAWWLWWWLLASVWWVKWDVSGGFLMGLLELGCLEEEGERGRGRERERERNSKKRIFK